jgi:hypothetical protein
MRQAGLSILRGFARHWFLRWPMGTERRAVARSPYDPAAKFKVVILAGRALSAIRG